MSIHQLLLNQRDCKPVFLVDVEAAIYASLTRVLEQARTENRLGVFYLMGRQAARDLASPRQQHVDALWWVAEQADLVDSFGVDAVQAALSQVFEDARS